MSTLLKLTISGPPGSGTSTLVAKIAESRGWRSMNGGDVFREEARSRGLTVEELSSEAKEDPDVDRHLDELLQKRMSSPESPEIVESRLSGWWAHKNDLECLRVWVSVSEKERHGVFRRGKGESLQIVFRDPNRDRKTTWIGTRHFMG